MPSGRRDSERARRVGLALGALALLLLAALAVPEGYSLADGDADARIVLPAITPLLQYVMVLAGVVMIVALVVLRASLLGDERRARTRSRSRWRYVALILVAAALWATFSAWRQQSVRTEGGRPSAAPTPAPQQTPGGREDAVRPEYSEPFGYAVAVLLLLAVGGLAVVVVLAARRKDVGSGAAPTPERLAEMIEAGVEDLETIADPRSAVIACYSRMELVVDAAGIARRSSDAPFELLARLLVQERVPEQSARRLTELFEEAKFSTRRIDEPMRQEALDALLDVRDRLAGPVEVHA